VDGSRAGWFAVEIACLGLIIHFMLGTEATIMFLLGWWWCETIHHPAVDHGRDGDDEIG
jgi:hypothetical protein